MSPHRALSIVMLLGALLATTACAKDPGPDAGGKGAKESHGSASAVPGSYDDWCGEHQIPESGCTRCDPSLVAAFKATDDWCVEHGLPESHCLKCDPELKIVRPPKPGGE